jgi:hypothetical protein
MLSVLAEKSQGVYFLPLLSLMSKMPLLPLLPLMPLLPLLFSDAPYASAAPVTHDLVASASPVIPRCP